MKNLNIKLPKAVKCEKFYVKDTFLQFHWYVQLGGTIEEAQEYYEKEINIKPRWEPISESLGCFLTVLDYENTGAIWIRDYSSELVVAHECTHAVLHVCRVLKINPLKAEEFVARYHEFLLGEIADAFIKRHKKLK